MYNIREFLSFYQTLGNPEYVRIQNHSNVMYKAFKEMKFSESELQEIADRGNCSGPTGILNAVGDLRKDTPNNNKYKACLYIIACEYSIPSSVLPRPSRGMCSRCLFKARCRTIFSRRDSRCSHFVEEDVESFRLKIGTKELVYDRGLYAEVNPSTALPVNQPIVGSPFDMFKDEIIDPTKCTICDSIIRPFNKPLLKYGVRPNRGETYVDYAARVDAIVYEIEKSFTEEEAQEPQTDEERVKKIFIMLGHEEMLRNTFAGDVTRMAKMFFPGKTLQNIVLQFGGGKKRKKTTSHDVYKILKKDVAYAAPV